MFVKGQSGNPSGRPKIPEETKQKFAQGAVEGIDFWLETLRNVEAKWEHRDRAAEKLVAYGYGKPKEIVDIDLNGRVEGAPVTFAFVDPPKTSNASSEEV